MHNASIVQIKGTNKYTIVENGKILDGIEGRQFSVNEAKAYAKDNGIAATYDKDLAKTNAVEPFKVEKPTVTLTAEQTARQEWMSKVGLSGDVDSASNIQLYNNRSLTVNEYIKQFRAGAVKEVLPGEAANMTVEEALRAGKVGDTNVRKLITDNREKFNK